jgi:alpha-N-arabinofuranosidase
MRRAGSHMDGLSLHYYTVPHVWGKKGSATKFNEEEWFITLRNALKLEELLERHGGIMDRYDPEKRVGLIVDEWGTWFDVEPGTNPGFLYQQNTLRDALVAGLSLNIFNKYSDRVHMANIAQTVNVLQAMILTDKEKMILTPTYHVFEMYKVHQDATLLPTYLSGAEYSCGDNSIPALNASASKDESGKIHITLCNTDHATSAKISCELRGATAKSVSGRILSDSALSAHNTFEKPQTVQPRAFTDFRLDGQRLTLDLPAASVAVLEIS